MGECVALVVRPIDAFFMLAPSEHTSYIGTIGKENTGPFLLVSQMLNGRKMVLLRNVIDRVGKEIGSTLYRPIATDLSRY